MSDSDPDSQARRSLAWHRGFATLLLLAMGALTLGTYAMPALYWTGVLQAAAKAGFVGGIADWFAVTALFRHPLGIPIPHTAIIPRQKERLGQALGRFVARGVFTPEDVGRILGGLDIPAILRRFLSDPAAARPAAEALAAMLPRLLATIEDGRARRVLIRLAPRLISGQTTGHMVARALMGLVEGGRHQEVFGFIINQLRTVLAEREEAMRAAIAERVREQGGRLIGRALGASIARRVLAQINAELDRVSPDGSELRAAFDEWLRREIMKLQADPARAAELAAAIRMVMTHETVRAWLTDVWSRLRHALELDAMRPNGRTVAFLEGALGNLGALLESDPDARRRLRAATESVAVSLLPAAQEQLAEFIARVVGGWDARTITDRLELRVGKDLQFVRINGTLVGFLAGGLVYVALHWMFGEVRF